MHPTPVSSYKCDKILSIYSLLLFIKVAKSDQCRRKRPTISRIIEPKWSTLTKMGNFDPDIGHLDPKSATFDRPRSDDISNNFPMVNVRQLFSFSWSVRRLILIMYSAWLKLFKKLEKVISKQFIIRLVFWISLNLNSVSIHGYEVLSTYGYFFYYWHTRLSFKETDD